MPVHWSVFLGIAVILYAVWVLVRHFRRMRRGDCAACPYSGACGGECGKK